MNVDLPALLAVVGATLTIVAYISKVAGTLARIEQTVGEQKEASKKRDDLLENIRNDLREQNLRITRLEVRVEGGHFHD
jgi:hypothetical protein